MILFCCFIDSKYFYVLLSIVIETFFCRNYYKNPISWYRLLPKFEQNGMKKPYREWVKKLIKKVCDDLGVTRESLNKFAGARAVMYFQGNWSSVKFDDVKSLAGNGTDILFIEKMGIVDLPITMAIPYLCLPCCFHFLRCSSDQ